jgi:hypothetical protein
MPLSLMSHRSSPPRQLRCAGAVQPLQTLVTHRSRSVWVIFCMAARQEEYAVPDARSASYPKSHPVLKLTRQFVASARRHRPTSAGTSSSAQHDFPEPISERSAPARPIIARQRRHGSTLPRNATHTVLGIVVAATGLAPEQKRGDCCEVHLRVSP